MEVKFIEFIIVVLLCGGMWFWCVSGKSLVSFCDGWCFNLGIIGKKFNIFNFWVMES